MELWTSMRPNDAKNPKRIQSKLQIAGALKNLKQLAEANADQNNK